jgi:hypothetical protein
MCWATGGDEFPLRRSVGSNGDRVLGYPTFSGE